MAYPYCPLCGKDAGRGHFYSHMLYDHGIYVDTYLGGTKDADKALMTCGCGLKDPAVYDLVEHALNCEGFARLLAASVLAGTGKLLEVD